MHAIECERFSRNLRQASKDTYGNWDPKTGLAEILRAPREETPVDAHVEISVDNGTLGGLLPTRFLALTERLRCCIGFGSSKLSLTNVFSGNYMQPTRVIAFNVA